jgi:hypothetical protein
MNKYEKELDKIHAKFGNEVEKYAKEVFNKAILPYLKKNKMKFLTGMGTYYLEDSKEKHIWSPMHYNNKDELLEDIELKVILETLNLYVPGFPANNFGSFMPEFYAILERSK